MDIDAQPTSSADSQSIGTLLSGLIGDLQQLIRGEINLAKTEVREELGVMAKAAQLLGAALVFALVGLTIFMLGVAVYLEKWLDRWQALGLDGLILLVIAAIAGMAGKSRLQASNIAPERTIESLKEDKAWASQQVKSVKS